MPADITVPGPGLRARSRRCSSSSRRRSSACWSRPSRPRAARRGTADRRRPSSGLLGALAATVLLAGTEELVFADAIAVDGPALFLQGTLAVLGIASVLLISERSLDSSGGAVVARAAVLPGSREDAALAEATEVQTEIYPLAMFSLGGMMLFPASNNLLLMFVALEVLSLPLYLMAGLARRRRLLSQEAAVKYFLLGAFASAFFLYGVALLYGYAGSVDLGEVLDRHHARPAATRACCSSGWRCWPSACCSRSAPCRSRPGRPTSTRARPTPVTALMAACTKIAAFGALLRVFYVGFGRTEWDWRPMLWAVAILTMVVGGVLAVTQTDVKRMLAYSSVAHTGFLLVGVVALSPRGPVGHAVLPAGLRLHDDRRLRRRDARARQRAARRPTSRSGRASGKRSPLVAGTFAFLLLALAGIPLTSGFMAKFAVFTAGVEGGATALVIVGVVTSAVTAFFYARVIVLMFFSEPAADGPTVAVPERLHRRRDRARPGRDGRARRRAPAGARPRGRRRRGSSPSGAPPQAPSRPPTRALAQDVKNGLEDGRGAPAGGRRQRPPDAHRDRQPPRRGGRQAVPPAAGAAGRAARRPVGARCRSTPRSSSSSPTWPRSTTTTSWTRPTCARGAVRQHPLDQHRRHPHRRLPVRPRVRPHGRPRHRGDPPAVAHLRPARRGPDRRDRRARRRPGRRSSTTCRCWPTRPARSSRPPPASAR